MNNLKKKRLAIIIAVVFLISSTATAIACNDGGIVDIPVDCDYDYPVKPGMPDWTGSKEDMEALQIPEHILQCISTEKLTKLCLEYPFFNLIVHDFITTALNGLYTHFNGFREIAKRDDATNYLCKEYILEFKKLEDTVLKYPYLFDKPYSDYNDEEKLIRYNISGCNLKISTIESTLGYSKLYNNISKGAQKKILKNLWYGYNEKIKYADKYGLFKGHFEYNLFARANIIITIDTTLSEIFKGDNEYILLNGMATNEDIINKMDSLTIELIK